MTLAHVDVRAARPYRVTVGPGALALASEHVPASSRAAVVSDRNVGPLHAAALGPLESAPRLLLEPGGAHKGWDALAATIGFLHESGLDRDSTVVALGGGVVGDVAGLAASLYMRGIGVVQCPTSLLAQVDAAVGGKTGIDHAGSRNLVGTFHAPLAVLADTAVLATLPDAERRAGLGEAVKSALVGDPELLDLLEREADACLAGDAEVLAELVLRCVRVKAAVVGRDEREAGERRALNLGHTFAHALEACAGPGRLRHGEAVAAGLGAALATARELGLLEDEVLPERVGALLVRLELPASLADVRARLDAPLPAADLRAAMAADKKGRGGQPRLVLPRRAGALALDVALDDDLLERLLG